VEDLPKEHERQAASWTSTVIISVLILAAAGGIAAWTFMTEPTAEKAGATKRTAMLVDVMTVNSGAYEPQLVAQGTVEPAQEVILRPRVRGRVVSMAESLTPGGHVQEGQRLLQIDPSDYRNTVAQRESQLGQAKSNLTIEKGLHQAAKAEYDYVEEDLPKASKARMLREPQLQVAKEEVKAAKAALNQAQLELRRTSIEAPFDAQVIRRDINVGSQLTPSDTIARLVGTDAYWISVELPQSQLQWLSTERDSEGEGSRVVVRNRQGWPEGATREGQLSRVVGTLDDSTRMVRVLATVPDPLGRSEDGEDTQPLMLGAFVEVTLHGETLKDVIRLDREYVRTNDTAWVMKDGELEVRDLDILMKDATYAYIAGGLDDGDKVVTTNLATVVDGAPLRLEETTQNGSPRNGEEEGGE
jgi:RND family efflux transporter MFP subunit